LGRQLSLSYTISTRGRGLDDNTQHWSWLGRHPTTRLWLGIEPCSCGMFECCHLAWPHGWFLATVTQAKYDMFITSVQLSITFFFFFLKSNIRYVGPSCRKTDPIVSLKKVVEVVQELCQELYNNHFSTQARPPFFVFNLRGIIIFSCYLCYLFDKKKKKT
jgi:hypothetical protein